MLPSFAMAPLTSCTGVLMDVGVWYFDQHAWCFDQRALGPSFGRCPQDCTSTPTPMNLVLVVRSIIQLVIVGIFSYLWYLLVYIVHDQLAVLLQS